MKKYLGKSYRKMMQALSLLCSLCLLLCCVPSMQAKAATLADQVTDTVAFGKNNKLYLPEDGTAVILKIVLKVKGYVELDFSPQKTPDIYYQFYDEKYNLIQYNTKGDSGSYTKMYFNNYDAGTYYLKMWCDGGESEKNYTYFARMIPSSDVNIEICFSLKKGQSLQLGAIISNCKDKKLKWSSSKKSVATVSSSGKVKALKIGTARIKASNSSGLVSTIQVKVTG